MSKPARGAGYWQGQVDAKLGQIAKDVEEIKTRVDVLRLWQAKVVGIAIAVSAMVSGLWNYLGGGK